MFEILRNNGFILSSLLEEAGFIHGFSTRWAPGVSTGPFSRANYSSSDGDPPSNVEQNFKLLAELLNLPRERFCSPLQVHSANLLLIDSSEPDSGKIPISYLELPPSKGDSSQGRGVSDPTASQFYRRDYFRQSPNCSEFPADGVISFERDFAVGVKTADCIPILLAELESGTCAAVHAGWRGLMQKIVPLTLKVWREKLGFSGNFVAAVGPSICRKCYQVGPEVVQNFPSEVWEPDPAEGGKFLLDVKAEARRQLLDSGLSQESIDIIELCTRCDPDGRFFSYRRDGRASGRMFNFIAKIE